MSDIQFDYDELVQNALKGAIRKVLKHVEENGMPGEHHFYITFDTNAEGVTLPTHLKERYADDMTIVLQHRYWGLKVHEDCFELKLSFDSKPELLVIPFGALIAFVDPSAQFALQFSSDLYPPEDLEQDIDAVQDIAESGDAVILTPKSKKTDDDSGPDIETEITAEADSKGDNDNVVALDTFRKNS